MSYRISASFGKRQEFAAIAELIRMGYDTYITLVDDQGIDCIIRQNSKSYFDVQIKARSKDCNPKNSGFFPILNISQPRSNYVFIFYSERCEVNGSQGVYWVIPSNIITRPGFGNVLKSGKNMGKYRLKLTNFSVRRGVVTPRPKYLEFINAFEKSFGKPKFSQCKG